jgi:hypothetical protein
MTVDPDRFYRSGEKYYRFFLGIALNEGQEEEPYNILECGDASPLLKRGRVRAFQMKCI